MTGVKSCVFGAILLIVHGGAWAQKHGDKADPVDIISCGDVTTSPESYFVNPNFPDPDSGTGVCSVTVNSVSVDTCQVRLDFIGFELSQPDTNGHCYTDFFLVDGAATSVPLICGFNTGQHFYVDFDSAGSPLSLLIDRTQASLPSRHWEIKIEHIPCSTRAPKDCLQYYKETSGRVQSLNFHNDMQDEIGTRQLADTNYAVCIDKADGYCGVLWERNTTVGSNGFTLTGIHGATVPIGDPAACSTGAACPNDHIIIPGGVDDNGLQADRYCGLGFPNRVISTKKPFTLFVTTDGDELTDEGNRGFSLLYRQIITC